MAYDKRLTSETRRKIKSIRRQSKQTGFKELERQLQAVKVSRKSVEVGTR